MVTPPKASKNPDDGPSQVVVLRRNPGTDQGIFGRLITPSGYSCYTLELPNRQNKANQSCILPKGKYKVIWNKSPKFKRKMYLVSNVPKRSGIRIHSANYAGDKKKGYKKQLYGCIALGKRTGILEGQKALLVSKPAVREFEKLMEYKDFTLEIK